MSFTGSGTKFTSRLPTACTLKITVDQLTCANMLLGDKLLQNNFLIFCICEYCAEFNCTVDGYI